MIQNVLVRKSLCSLMVLVNQALSRTVRGDLDFLTKVFSDEFMTSFFCLRLSFQSVIFKLTGFIVWLVWFDYVMYRMPCNRSRNYTIETWLLYCCGVWRKVWSDCISCKWLILAYIFVSMIKSVQRIGSKFLIACRLQRKPLLSQSHLLRFLLWWCVIFVDLQS